VVKLIVQHSPNLLACVGGLHRRLRKPPWQHVWRLADALMVSEARHKPMAGFSRLLVDAPDPSNGADTRRISPWTAEEMRSPLRHVLVTDVVAYAHPSDPWTLDGSLDDALGEKDRGPRHLEAVESHHDHPTSAGKTSPSSTKGSVPVEVR
jgi:hypothetical protein